MKKEITIKMGGVDGSMPIAQLVQLANSFESRIYIIQDEVKVNAKSIMGMMNMLWSQGNTVTLDIQGDDEEQAMARFEDYLSKENE